MEEVGLDQFDVVVCDVGIHPIATYFHLLGQKSVVLNSLMTMAQPSLEWPMPLTSSGQSDDLSFLERFLNAVLLERLTEYMTRSLLEPIVQSSDRYRTVLTPHSDFLSYPGTKLPMIVASAQGFDYPKPRLPLVEYVGSLMLQSPPPLDKSLERWLESKPPQSVVYISMGTTASLSSSAIKSIYDGTLVSTSYSVVWVMTSKERSRLESLDVDAQSDRLFLTDWVSQQTLLEHGAIAMSVVHCGLNSVHESIFNLRPVICFPSLYDQFEVATRVQSASVGMAMYGLMDKLLGSDSVSSETLADAIHRISSQDYLSKNVTKVKRILEVAGGSSRAADLVEFYADVGYDHLVPAYLKYGWGCVQYYNWDVWVMLLMLVVSVLCCCWKCIVCVRRHFCYLGLD